MSDSSAPSWSSSSSTTVLAPAQPTPTQRAVVSGGAARWFVQTPLCAAAAGWTFMRFRRIPVRSPQARAIWRIISYTAAPIMAWDTWYYHHACKAVASAAEWERSQWRGRGRDPPAEGFGGGGGSLSSPSPSSADDIQDPWA